MPRRLLSAAAAGALLLVLTACGEGEEGPVTTAPPEIGVNGPSDGGGDTDPSDGGGDQTEEPTADAPDIPPPDPADYAGMDENTEDGATQAFRYYIAMSMWAHQTGDDSMLMQLQSDSCNGCGVLNEELPELKESGTYWSPFEVTSVEITPHPSKNFDFEIGYSFTVPEHTRPDPESGEPVEFNPIEYNTVGGMTWATEGWVVGGLNSKWGPDVH
ncbi:DUF6318 family protein [Brachybacterium massiliense]|uniref:DUF6318 family protein n=1 Tax=Brachybacterium massiliense TaxID=1755098 RepID=UPI000B3BCF25|nr:DUF6318 family protein [Brachybacterium massiliense]